MSVEDNILYICNSSVCSCVRLNLKNLFYFVFVLSLSGCVAVNEERRSRGFLVVSTHDDFYHFYHFYQTCPKVFQNDKRKNFQKQTHTHTQI